MTPAIWADIMVYTMHHVMCSLQKFKMFRKWNKVGKLAPVAGLAVPDFYWKKTPAPA